MAQHMPRISPLTPHAWCVACLAAAGYTLGAIADLFGFPGLFNNAYSPTVLQSMGQTLQAYIIGCAPGNPNGIACATFSPSCAAQTYAAGGCGLPGVRPVALPGLPGPELASPALAMRTHVFPCLVPNHGATCRAALHAQVASACPATALGPGAPASALAAQASRDAPHPRATANHPGRGPPAPLPTWAPTTPRRPASTTATPTKAAAPPAGAPTPRSPRTLASAGASASLPAAAGTGSLRAGAAPPTASSAASAGGAPTPRSHPTEGAAPSEAGQHVALSAAGAPPCPHTSPLETSIRAARSRTARPRMPIPVVSPPPPTPPHPHTPHPPTPPTHTPLSSIHFVLTPLIEKDGARNKGRQGSSTRGLQQQQLLAS